MFLTFFTNIVLLACFLGMSVGCLAASRKTNFILYTPPLLAVAMLAAVELSSALRLRGWHLDIGHQGTPQMVFFGTEVTRFDPARFLIPIEVVCAGFFLLIALVMLGPGQELGRALNRVPERVHAYTVNILGSLAGIVAFAACSWFELSPGWWFLVVVAVLLAVLPPQIRKPARASVLALLLVSVGAILLEAWWPTSQASQAGWAHFWSPYYRIDYDPKVRYIEVNQISHQVMISHDAAAIAYPLPYLFRRDTDGGRFDDVLIIGAGSGNDVSWALRAGAQHVDAVEIDPVIQRLGKLHHPEHPYDDPRVSVHLDDGRNFLRTTSRKYDLIVFALVDSLVLHSSYSNIRLESYLFTLQSFVDVRRHLKPKGVFVTYNYFRQGWIVDRLYRSLGVIFGAPPLVFVLPYTPVVTPGANEGFTMLFAGDTAALRAAFRNLRAYTVLVRNRNAVDISGNGFTQVVVPGQNTSGIEIAPATVTNSGPLPLPTDEWPFLYLREPVIPTFNARAMALMALIALGLIVVFLPKPPAGKRSFRVDWRMFFLGAGFMLIETRSVVQMALLFGSTWMVNTIVFFAVLLMILGANLFTLRFRPAKMMGYYLGLTVTLAVNLAIPVDTFLGGGRLAQAACCLMVFSPVLFAGVIFAAAFAQSRQPDRDFGANIAGAMVGGLSEYTSMLLGFRYLLLVALAYYLGSALFELRGVAATEKELAVASAAGSS